MFFSNVSIINFQFYNEDVLCSFIFFFFFQTQVKANAVVAYVDAPVDSSEIFIRCHNSEDAQTILKEKKLNHLGEAQLIEGWCHV